MVLVELPVPFKQTIILTTLVCVDILEAAALLHLILRKSETLNVALLGPEGFRGNGGSKALNPKPSALNPKP